MQEKVVVSIVSLVILACFLLAGYYYFNDSELPETIMKPKKTVEQVIEEKAINDPFADLTIPYLRNREYKGEITSQEQYTSNSSYTSYIASYDSDELNINGLLTVPNSEEPEGGWPAVVFVHGYIPPTVYQTTSNYASYVDYLASRGIVVFKIDLRGHSDSEGIASGAYYSGDYIIDTLNAYNALQSLEFVNESKVGLWGHSMAGNVVFRSMVAKQDIPVTVIWAGAVYTYEDFQEYSISDNSYRPPSDESERRRRRTELAETHGSFDVDDEFWQTVVPTNYLDGITSNLQIHHAKNDNVVSIEYTRNIKGILEKSKINHEIYEYDSGGHNIDGVSFSQAMSRTAAAFNSY